MYIMSSGCHDQQVLLGVRTAITNLPSDGQCSMRAAPAVHKVSSPFQCCCRGLARPRSGALLFGGSDAADQGWGALPSEHRLASALNDVFPTLNSGSLQHGDRTSCSVA